MSLSRVQLKEIFETGDYITQNSLYNFIDGTFNLNDDIMSGATGPTGATGATGTLQNTPVNYLDFNSQILPPTYRQGRMYYANGDLNVYVDEPDITLQVGQEQWIKVRNRSGFPILNGSVVYIDGAQGQRPTIQKASNTTHNTSNVIGIATHDIEHNSFGYITTSGLVNGIDTAMYNDGDEIFLGSTAGTFTKIHPIAPAHEVKVGIVVNATNNGSVLVQVTNAVDFDDITEVLINSPQNLDRLIYNSSTQRWENKPPQDYKYVTVGNNGSTTYYANSSERIFVEHSVPFTIIGATAPSINTVYEIIDKLGTGNVNNITFNGNGKTIRGFSTWNLSQNWSVLKIVYNGTSYNVINELY